MGGESFALGAVCWLDQILRASLLGGLGIGLVWLWIRLVPGTGAAVRTWLWRLAYLKLVMALLWFAPIRLDVSTQVTAPATAQVTALANHFPYSTHVVVLSVLLLGLWFGGLWLGWRSLRRAQRAARRLLRDSTPVTDPSLLADFRHLVTRFGLRQEPSLRWCTGVDSPGVVRPSRPVVLLPAVLAEGARSHGATRHDSEHLRLAIAHELAHLRRQDLRWSWIPRLARILFFFHPLIRLAERSYLQSQEMAADALALRITRSEPSRMAQSLLAMIETVPDCRPGPVLGLHRSGSYRELRARILMMARRPRAATWCRALCGLGLIFALVVMLPPWRPVATPGHAIENSRPLRAGAVRLFDRLYGCYLSSR